MLNRRQLVGGSSLILLAGLAASLSSQNITLTTSYPAPCGIYAQVITTGGDPANPHNTILARDRGNVGVRTNNPQYALDVNGDINALDIQTGNGSFSSLSAGTGSIGSLSAANASIGNSLWVGGSVSAGSAFYAWNPLAVSGIFNLLAGNLAAGNLWVAGSKNFRINHPLDPERRYLVHATVEGPEAAVFYRGEGRLARGRAVIRLPVYFEKLTQRESRTVLLTPRFEADEPISSIAASAVAGGRFVVRALDGKNPAQKFYWEVKAVRADIPALETEISKEQFQARFHLR